MKLKIVLPIALAVCIIAVSLFFLLLRDSYYDDYIPEIAETIEIEDYTPAVSISAVLVDKIEAALAEYALSQGCNMTFTLDGILEAIRAIEDVNTVKWAGEPDIQLAGIGTTGSVIALITILTHDENEYTKDINFTLSALPENLLMTINDNSENLYTAADVWPNTTSFDVFYPEHWEFGLPAIGKNINGPVRLYYNLNGLPIRDINANIVLFQGVGIEYYSVYIRIAGDAEFTRLPMAGIRTSPTIDAAFSLSSAIPSVPIPDNTIEVMISLTSLIPWGVFQNSLTISYYESDFDITANIGVESALAAFLGLYGNNIYVTYNNILSAVLSAPYVSSAALSELTIIPATRFSPGSVQGRVDFIIDNETSFIYISSEWAVLDAMLPAVIVDDSQNLLVSSRRHPRHIDIEVFPMHPEFNMPAIGKRDAGVAGMYYNMGGQIIYEIEIILILHEDVTLDSYQIWTRSVGSDDFIRLDLEIISSGQTYADNFNYHNIVPLNPLPPYTVEIRVDFTGEAGWWAFQNHLILRAEPFVLTQILDVDPVIVPFGTSMYQVSGIVSPVARVIVNEDREISIPVHWNRQTTPYLHARTSGVYTLHGVIQLPIAETDDIQTDITVDIIISPKTAEQGVLFAAVAQMLIDARNDTSEVYVIARISEAVQGLPISITDWMLTPADDTISGRITGILNIGDLTTPLYVYIPSHVNAPFFHPRIRFYEFFIESESNWIRSLQIVSADPGLELAIGAIPDRHDGWLGRRIIPYFSAMAVTGLLDTENPDFLHVVRGYIDWHFNNLNDGSGNPPNIRDIDGTVFDYYVVTTRNETTGGRHAIEYGYYLHYWANLPMFPNYDSSDSYASLMLIVLNRYFLLTGDTRLLIDNFHNINRLVYAIYATWNPLTNLTGAKIDFMIEYLMDNAEVAEGFYNARQIYTVLLDLLEGTDRELAMSQLELVTEGFYQVLEAIEYHMWVEYGGFYLPYRGAQSFSWETFYADATCQILAITTGVTAHHPGRAEALMAMFNHYYSSAHSLFNWEYIDESPGSFIWSSIVFAAAITGDFDRVNTFIESYMKRFILSYRVGIQTHSFPIYSADAGTAIRAAVLALEHYRNLASR